MNKKEFKLKIEECLAEQRQGLLMHGGGIELVDADPKTGIVKVKLQGACIGCPMAQMTLKEGIEAELMDRIPLIKKVVGV